MARDSVGSEGAAVEEAIAAEHQAALHRSRPDRRAEAAFEFRTGAGEGSRRACERGPVNVGAEHARRRRRVAFGIAAAVPPDHLRIEPCGLASPGEVRRLAILEHEVGVMDRFAAGREENAIGDRAQKARKSTRLNFSTY